jgi:mRNA interferase MazF
MAFVIPKPYQWQLLRADLEPVRGSEQAGDRPVLVVSRESFNESLPTFAVVPVTTRKPGRRIYSTEVLLPAGMAGNPNDSVIMAHQVRTIDQVRVHRSYGRLEDEEIRMQVRAALITFLEIE